MSVFRMLPEVGEDAKVGKGAELRGCCVEGEVGQFTKVWRFAHVMRGAKIGDYCMIGQGVFVADDVVIGNHVRIQNHTDVSRGVRIEDHVYVGAGVRFCNSVHPSAEHDDELKTIIVRRGASIGSNVCIVGAVEIGPHATVGAGAVVTKDVPANATVMGVPAKVVETGEDHSYPIWEEFLER